MLGLHGALLLLALQTDALERALPEVLPVRVSLLAADEPATPPVRTLLPAPAQPAAPDLPVPQFPSSPWPAALSAQASPEAAAPAEPMVPPATPAAAEPDVAAAPAPVSAAPAAAAPQAEARQMPPGAISYRVPPAIAVPLASRRLRESGTVWLRVRVDRQGLPVQVSVHQSSGYPRLDEQALTAMQAARFVPKTENGAPIDWVVIAPLAYEID